MFHNLSHFEMLQFISGLLGSFVGGLFFIRKMKQSLPQIAADLLRLLGPLLRELLADEVKELVAEELQPTHAKLASLKADHDVIAGSVQRLWERERARSSP
ncbi:MAG: hypothetical protein ACJ8AT_31260 [Hyalangium sp.]|uniref:hypothetical protein n=1 Tax=Hyalangium sp. TaxID=2028555 RepID=UPI00389A50AC